jgi:lactate dehydrogenase-like 2-hydroxyacid dehydrogenase
MTVKPAVSSRRRRVFVSFPVLQSVRALIAERCDAVFNETGRTLSPAVLVQCVDGCDTLMITTSDRLDRNLLRELPKTVRTIATYSVGHDHVDLEAAAELGLVVLHTPEVLTDAVAEIAMFLILGAARRGTESIDLLRSQTWSGWSPTQLPGVQLSGKSLGIVGMGRIGRAVARRATVFGMTPHYTRSAPLRAEEASGATCHATLDDLLAVSQLLLLSCPSTAGTRGLLNAERIKQLPDGAIVINVARGDILEDDALIAALSSGKLLAAGLDVFAHEPSLDSRYFELPNVFMTPHIGSSTIEAREAMARILLESAEELDRGGTPANRLV